MSVISSNALAGASGQGGYFLTKSLRFRGSSSAFLNRTPASTSNRRTWTWSGWVKIGSDPDGFFPLFGADANAYPCSGIALTNYNIQFFAYTDPTYAWQKISTMVLRDPSAWYHIVAVTDTTNGTAEDRARVYVNGQRVTSWSTNNNPSSSYEGYVNSSSYVTKVGRVAGFGYFDGYMSEVNFVDGQALDPSAFGETSTSTGVWIPKKYTGTYGTNGFYLDFEDNSSTAALGYDAAGSNDFTANNISLTAGSTYDSMNDVPTLTNATTANYCVMSPIASSPLISLTNGNLTAGGTDEASLIGTIGVNSGKWYWEVTLTSGSFTPYLGVSSNSFDKSGSGSNYLLAGISWYGNGLKKAYTGTSSTSATSNTTGVYGFALDISAGTLAYYFNNSLVFTDTTIPTSGVTLFALVAHTNSGSASWNPANFNFGQRPFTYTPPTGFLQLNTFNLPTPTIGATASTQANEYMDVTLWTGNGSTQSIVNSSSMQPDCVWIKNRTGANNHARFDSVRGATLRLYETTLDEQTETNTLTSFNSNGFSVGSAPAVNSSSNNYVAWQWKANGTGSSNTAGSITSTVSANTTAGFSIVTWTGNGASSATIGHGLGVAPSMIIVKNRSATWGWFVYNKFLTNPNTGRLQLNLTNGEIAGGTPGPWNNTAPTSTVFSLGDSTFPEVNGSGNLIVAYCFAPVAGYSAFGSYTGNGSTNGPFIFTGFRPRFVMIKGSSTATSWNIFDSSRNTYNLADLDLYPNLSNAETVDIYGKVDLLSNGFKLRPDNTTFGINQSGATYIYMAFAEVPQKFALGR